MVKSISEGETQMIMWTSLVRAVTEGWPIILTAWGATALSGFVFVLWCRSGIVYPNKEAKK